MATAVYISNERGCTEVVIDPRSNKEVVFVGRSGGGAAPVRVVGAGVPGALHVRPTGARFLDSTDFLTYQHEILGTDPSNLLAYWPLTDLDTNIALDRTFNGRNGVYNNVTLNQTGIVDNMPSVLLNGSTSFINIFTTSLQSVFNGPAGTLAGWMRVSSGAVWTDATVRRIWLCFADANNFVSIYRSATNNTIAFDYVAGGTTKSVASTVIGGSTAWAHVAITWDKAADQVKAYINGTQTGAAQTGLGTWAGLLSSTQTVLGALNTTPSQVWSGFLNHMAIWKAALSPANVANLATV